MSNKSATQRHFEKHGPILVRNEDGGFVMQEWAEGAGIRVGNVWVYVERTDEGVTVNLYPLGVGGPWEDWSLDMASATFTEARDEQEEKAAEDLAHVQAKADAGHERAKAALPEYIKKLKEYEEASNE
jgi:hypothetical protein